MLDINYELSIIIQSVSQYTLFPSYSFLNKQILENIINDFIIPNADLIITIKEIVFHYFVFNYIIIIWPYDSILNSKKLFYIRKVLKSIK